MKKRKRLDVVECEGTAFEIGRRYGSACRESLEASIEVLFASVGEFLPTGKPCREEIIDVALKHLPLVEAFDPMLIETLRGQAAGALIPFEEIFALRCKFELGLYYPSLLGACTSFAVAGSVTRDGKTIIGQNYDLTYDTTVDLVRTIYPDGRRQLSLVFSGGGAGEVSLTSHGLGVVLNLMISPMEEHELSLPCSCVIPKAMRQKNIGDALGVFCAGGRSILFYALASAQGDIIGIETKPGDYGIIDHNNGVITHANHYLTERFKKGELIGIFGKACSYIREPRLRDLIERERGSVTVEYMMHCLADHHNYPCAICAHPDPDRPGREDGTLCSVVMVPEDQKMWIAWRNPCEYEYEEYAL